MDKNEYGFGKNVRGKISVQTMIVFDPEAFSK
jgi:hypothetical protein